MSSKKDPNEKTDLQRRFLIGSSLALAGTAASGVLTGCGGNVGTGGAGTGSATGAGTPPAATPALAPVGGTYPSTQSVTISSSTSGASIYYTADGSPPTTSSTLYSRAIPVSATTTVRAIATASGFQQSNVGSAAYTISGAATPMVATPKFTPATGAYASAQSVTISCATSGAAIHYTTDGSTPTTSSSLYASPLTVSSTETVKAIATLSGDQQSNVGSAAYTIGAGSLTSPQNLQVINQGGPNNAAGTASYVFEGFTNNYSGNASRNYQGLSWLAASTTAQSVSKYNIYRATFTNGTRNNFTLYDSVLTPITITGYIAPGTDGIGAKCGVLTVTAVSGGTTSISDGKILPGLMLTSAASGFVPGTIVNQYVTATSGGGGTGKYNVTYSQTVGSSGSPATFQGWSYNDTAATNCVYPMYNAPGVPYAYAVTAFDSAGNESAQAYPNAYMYYGYSDTVFSQFNYDGVIGNWADTAGYPVNGPYDMYVTFPGGGGGLLLPWSGASPYPPYGSGPSGAPGSLCCAERFECGAFNYLTFDIKVTDNSYETAALQYIPVTRAYGGAGGGDASHWCVVDCNKYVVGGGSFVVGQWVTVKIPFSALTYGFSYGTGSFAATSPFNGTVTITDFTSIVNNLGPDCTVYISGPGIPANCSVNTNNYNSNATPPSGPGPWVYQVTSPNIIGTETGSGSYTFQGTSCYKQGWQWSMPATGANLGAFYINNIGFSTT